MLSAGSAFTPILPDVSSEATVVTSLHAAEGMQHGLDGLRDAIRRLHRRRRCERHPRQCHRHKRCEACDGTGAPGLTEPGDQVIVTAPTYMATQQYFLNHGVNFFGGAAGGEGSRY